MSWLKTHQDIVGENKRFSKTAIRHTCILSALLISIVAGFYFLDSYKLQRYTTKLNAISAKAKSIGSIERINQINDYLNKLPMPYIAVLGEVSDLADKSIVFKRIQLDREGAVRIEGQSPNLKKLDAFTIAMSKSEYFTGIELVRVQQSEGKYAFTFTGHVAPTFRYLVESEKRLAAKKNKESKEEKKEQTNNKTPKAGPVKNTDSPPTQATSVENTSEPVKQSEPPTKHKKAKQSRVLNNSQREKWSKQKAKFNKLSPEERTELINKRQQLRNAE